MKEVNAVPDKKIEDILQEISPAIKKEFLDTLVKSLLNDLKETEKKELLKKLVSGGRENREVINMVEH
ncbi:hypothetical protein BMS3Abin10_01524 [bacterium BMS3Abin10]|nr:hypothetical protein BMS3Abin10_01524 [bacterium BMS3Abin10]